MHTKEFGFTIKENLQEILPQFSYDFPLMVYGNLSYARHNNTGYFVPWHWHREFEINIVQRGAEFTCFGESSLLLTQGEGVFINANTLHMAKPTAENSSHLSIVFHSSMFSGHPQSLIERKYVLPIINCEQLQGMKLTREVQWQASVLDDCLVIVDAYTRKDFGFELEIQRKLLSLWSTFVNNTKKIVDDSKNKKPSPDDARVKTMMLHIHANYNENLTLQDIADSASLSVSECCRCFKRVLSMTPFVYLIQYRLETAAKMIQDTDKTISEIAHDVGFDTESYFSRKFKLHYGMTPSRYRKSPSPEDTPV